MAEQGGTLLTLGVDLDSKLGSFSKKIAEGKKRDKRIEKTNFLIDGMQESSYLGRGDKEELAGLAAGVIEELKSAKGDEIEEIMNKLDKIDEVLREAGGEVTAKTGSDEAAAEAGGGGSMGGGGDDEGGGGDGYEGEGGEDSEGDDDGESEAEEDSEVGSEGEESAEEVSEELEIDPESFVEEEEGEDSLYNEIVSRAMNDELRAEDIKRYVPLVEESDKLTEEQKADLREYLVEGFNALPKKGGKMGAKMAEFVFGVHYGAYEELIGGGGGESGEGGGGGEDKGKELAETEVEKLSRDFLRDYNLFRMFYQHEVSSTMNDSSDPKARAGRLALETHIDRLWDDEDPTKSVFVKKKDFDNFRSLVADAGAGYLALRRNSLVGPDVVYSAGFVAKYDALLKGIPENVALSNNAAFNAQPMMYGDYFNDEDFDRHNWEFRKGREKTTDAEGNEVDKLGIAGKLYVAAFAMLRRPSNDRFPNGRDVFEEERTFNARKQRSEGSNTSSEIMHYLMTTDNELLDHRGESLGFNIKKDLQEMLGDNYDPEASEDTMGGQVMLILGGIAASAMAKDNQGMHAEQWMGVREFAAPGYDQDERNEHLALTAYAKQKTNMKKALYDASKPKNGPGNMTMFLTDWDGIEGVTYDPSDSDYFSQKPEDVLRGNNMQTAIDWTDRYLCFLHTMWGKTNGEGKTLREQMTFHPQYYDQDGINLWDLLNPENPASLGDRKSDGVDKMSALIMKQCDEGMAKVAEISQEWPDTKIMSDLEKQFWTMGTQFSFFKNLCTYVPPDKRDPATMSTKQKRYMYVYDSALRDLKIYACKVFMALKVEQVQSGIGVGAYWSEMDRKKLQYDELLEEARVLMIKGFGAGIQVSNGVIEQELDQFVQDNIDIFTDTDTRYSKVMMNRQYDYIVEMLLDHSGDTDNGVFQKIYREFERKIKEHDPSADPVRVLQDLQTAPLEKRVKILKKYAGQASLFGIIDVGAPSRNPGSVLPELDQLRAL